MITNAIHCLPRQLPASLGEASCQDRTQLLVEGIAARYGLSLTNVVWHSRLRSLVELAESICKPIGGAHGLRTLDLGCGSNGGTLERDFSSLDPLAGRNYEPWLARILHELGARAFGVDLGDLTGEPYETLRCDLTAPGALEGLPSQEFDVVVMTNFFSSPHLRAQSSSKVLRTTMDGLRRDIQRLLRPQGVLFVRDLVDFGDGAGATLLDASTFLALPLERKLRHP